MLLTDFDSLKPIVYKGDPFIAQHYWYEQFNIFNAYQNFGPASLQYIYLCF